MKQAELSQIHTKVTVAKIGDWTIIQLPESASAKLPSRGQAMVEAVINDYSFVTPLEPDGKWSHWFSVDDKLLRAAKLAAGDKVGLTITPLKDWPEPEVPADFKHALAKVPEAQALYQQVTPMARWEWIRWIRSTNNQETRDRRLIVACSKLKNGTRRPCCWNRNLSTEPSVSKNGILLEAA